MKWLCNYTTYRNVIQSVIEMVELGVPLHVVILTYIGGTTMSRRHAFRHKQNSQGMKQQTCYMAFPYWRWWLFWVVVSSMFYFHLYLGKIPILIHIFQTGCNRQLVILFFFRVFLLTQPAASRMLPNLCKPLWGLSSFVVEHQESFKRVWNQECRFMSLG